MPPEHTADRPLIDTPPRELCLLRLSALGDCTHVVPLVRSLQAAWPQTRITWIIGQLEHQLLGDLPGVEFVVVDKGRGRRAYGDLRRALRGRQFDVLLQMQVSLRASLLGLQVPARQRLGFDRQRARDFQWLFTRHRIAHRPCEHVLDGFFGFADALGVRDRILRWDIPVPESDRAWAAQQLPGDRPVLAINPCSSERFRNFRNWPPERYARVAEHAVREHGLGVVLTGGPSETEQRWGQAIVDAADVAVTNLIGQTRLKQLLAVLERARVLVSPDSGPAHIANAAGTPVIGLYASSNPERTGPYCSREWTVNRYPEACRAAFGKPPEQLRWGRRVRDPEVMQRITVADVTERLDALLAESVTDAG